MRITTGITSIAQTRIGATTTPADTTFATTVAVIGTTDRRTHIGTTDAQTATPNALTSGIIDATTPANAAGVMVDTRK